MQRSALAAFHSSCWYSQCLALCLERGLTQRLSGASVSGLRGTAAWRAARNPSRMRHCSQYPPARIRPRHAVSIASRPKYLQLVEDTWKGWGYVTMGTPCNFCSLLHTSRRSATGDKQDQRPGDREREVSMSRGEKTLRLIGWLGGFYSRKAILTRSSKKLYDSCMDTVDFEGFFKVCNLPDSFQSWFLVAHLHVWLCMVRLKPEGKEGKQLTRELVATFWDDVQERMKLLGVTGSSVASKGVRELVHEFYGLTLAYDEGLLLDDQTLASAVWRNLFHNKEQTDPSNLLKVVEYIRSQVQHMDRLDSDNLLNTGTVQLLPFTIDE